jgi:hypothetical protein
MGFLQKPKATDEELAQVAVQCGADVIPQAVEQRQTPKLVKFLEALFRRSLAVVVGSPKSLAPILERFTQVTILGQHHHDVAGLDGGTLSGLRREP